MTSNFEYSGGAFKPLNTPAVEGDGDRMPGYSLSQSVGNTCGLSYFVYEKDDSGDTEWVVTFSTASKFCDIKCNTWPDLIDLLAKLSPIALAGVIGEDELDCLYELLEPTRRELRRRRVK